MQQSDAPLRIVALANHTPSDIADLNRKKGSKSGEVSKILSLKFLLALSKFLHHSPLCVNGNKMISVLSSPIANSDRTLTLSTATTRPTRPSCQTFSKPPPPSNSPINNTSNYLDGATIPGCFSCPDFRSLRICHPLVPEFPFANAPDID